MSMSLFSRFGKMWRIFRYGKYRSSKSHILSDEDMERSLQTRRLKAQKRELEGQIETMGLKIQMQKLENKMAELQAESDDDSDDSPPEWLRPFLMPMIQKMQQQQQQPTDPMFQQQQPFGSDPRHIHRYNYNERNSNIGSVGCSISLTETEIDEFLEMNRSQIKTLQKVPKSIQEKAIRSKVGQYISEKSIPMILERIEKFK